MKLICLKILSLMCCHTSFQVSFEEGGRVDLLRRRPTERKWITASQGHKQEKKDTSKDISILKHGDDKTVDASRTRKPVLQYSRLFPISKLLDTGQKTRNSYPTVLSSNCNDAELFVIYFQHSNNDPLVLPKTKPYSFPIFSKPLRSSLQSFTHPRYVSQNNPSSLSSPKNQKFPAYSSHDNIPSNSLSRQHSSITFSTSSYSPPLYPSLVFPKPTIPPYKYPPSDYSPPLYPPYDPLSAKTPCVGLIINFVWTKFFKKPALSLSHNHTVNTTLHPILHYPFSTISSFKNFTISLPHEVTSLQPPLSQNKPTESSVQVPYVTQTNPPYETSQILQNTVGVYGFDTSTGIEATIPSSSTVVNDFESSTASETIAQSSGMVEAGVDDFQSPTASETVLSSFGTTSMVTRPTSSSLISSEYMMINETDHTESSVQCVLLMQNQISHENIPSSAGPHISDTTKPALSSGSNNNPELIVEVESAIISPVAIPEPNVALLPCFIPKKHKLSNAINTSTPNTEETSQSNILHTPGTSSPASSELTPLPNNPSFVIPTSLPEDVVSVTSPSEHNTQAISRPNVFPSIPTTNQAIQTESILMINISHNDVPLVRVPDRNNSKDVPPSIADSGDGYLSINSGTTQTVTASEEDYFDE